MLEETRQLEKEETMGVRDRSIRMTSHRAGQFKVMGYARPWQILDAILYDMEASRRTYN
jgi:hypothetical protein